MNKFHALFLFSMSMGCALDEDGSDSLGFADTADSCLISDNVTTSEVAEEVPDRSLPPYDVLGVPMEIVATLYGFEAEGGAQYLDCEENPDDYRIWSGVGEPGENGVAHWVCGGDPSAPMLKSISFTDSPDLVTSYADNDLDGLVEEIKSASLFGEEPAGGYISNTATYQFDVNSRSIVEVALESIYNPALDSADATPKLDLNRKVQEISTKVDSDGDGVFDQQRVRRLEIHVREGDPSCTFSTL